MRRTDRLFEVIQILRSAPAPLIAADIADQLEVSKRTIYRDIAALQAMRTPISGEPGVGYIIRKSYDLPPINFDAEEAEAITVGLAMIARTGDAGLWEASLRVACKLGDAAPASDISVASAWGAPRSDSVDPVALRGAIRNENKLHIGYCNADQKITDRVIWPLVIIYYAQATVLVGHCELRQGFRHFRLDRITSFNVLDSRFADQGESLRQQWQQTIMPQSVTAPG
ncbi:MAG: YafY family protein [Paracoccaceae bacterium]